MSAEEHPKSSEGSIDSTIVIVRYVELRIQIEKVEEVRQLLKAQAPLVRSQDGCFHLEINESIDEAGLFSTYSYWTGVDALNLYRQSDVFRDFWNRVKPLFRESAHARSFVHLDTLS